MKGINIGFEFEFFYNTTVEDTLIGLEKTLNKEIEYFNEGHSDFEPDENKWKLERDYSGGKNMVELVTSPLDYEDALGYYDRIAKYIAKNGYTTEKCAIQINISFSDINKMYKFNKLKFILEMDEEKIYTDFPNRRNSLYTKSIKQIVPISKYYNENKLNIDPSNYKLPDSKYYGVDFRKLQKNYLEFRYLGGTDYEKKTGKVLNYIDYFISLMKKSTNTIFTEKNKLDLLRIIQSKREVLNSYNSFTDFQLSFPGIKLYVDLIKTRSHVQIYYDQIKDKLFDIISNSNIKDGIINYNTDYGSIELKDMKIDKVYELKNVDLINCEVRGNLENCNLFECLVDSSSLSACKMYQETIVKSSKLNNCYVSSGSTIKHSYIATGKYTVILGKMVNCIFRSGSLTQQAKNRSEDTEYISYKIIK